MRLPHVAELACDKKENLATLGFRKEFTFYLGTPAPSWLWRTDCGLNDTPLFVSRTTLKGRKKLPGESKHRWGLDSGAFTELTRNGKWTVTPKRYADECRKYADKIGKLDFCSIMDWMCEPFVIEGGRFGAISAPGTKLSVIEHQKRTVASYHDLSNIGPDIPWLPVLQGYTCEDYLRCVEMYNESGVDLSNRKVGVGSVCRRESTEEIASVFRSLSEFPNRMKLHGFGVKSAGLARSAGYLSSSDSMAWSLGAWKGRIKMPECVREGRGHSNCANCPVYATHWRDTVILPAIKRGLAA